jgi:hypothetical protein
MTDENPAYTRMRGHTTQERVNRLAKEWVRGHGYINSVEGVWSLFKRSIAGSYPEVSTEHIQWYLDEGEWNFNQRDNPDLFRDRLVHLRTRQHEA